MQTTTRTHPSARSLSWGRARARRPLLPLFATLLLTLALGPAQAASWYVVELVVFERLDGDGYGEYWPPDPGQPDLARAVEIGRGGGAFSIVDGGGLRLGGVVSELRKSGSFRPLLHVAWRQPGYGKSTAKPVHLRGGRVGAVVDGTVRVYRRRFLHVETDLIYRPAEGGFVMTPFRLRESRRMRSRELHYIDHPMFGVLVQITPG